MKLRIDRLKPKQLQNLQRKLLRILSSRKAVHTEVTIDNTSMVKSVKFDELGNCELSITPNRPHCPCCLLDLESLLAEIKGIKGIGEVRLIVVDVPDSEKWTRALNT